jgi:hypothetical protein
MIKPTKPTVPAPPLRSNPDTFSARMEASLLFWQTFAQYLDDVGDYSAAQASAALAAALAAGAGIGLDLTGNGGKVLAVNAGASELEFLPTSDHGKQMLALATGAGLALVSDEDAAAQRETLGLGDLATLSAADFYKGDAAWAAGVDPGQATISPAQLLAAYIAHRNASALGWGQTWQNVSGSRSVGTTYQNTTGRPIAVAVQGTNAASARFEVSVDTVTWLNVAEVGGGHISKHWL